MPAIAPIDIGVARGAEHGRTPGRLAVAVPTLTIGMARGVMGGEVGFRLDNDAGHEAIVMLTHQLLPQQCLRHDHGVAIVKGSREHVPLGHHASLDLLGSRDDRCCTRAVLPAGQGGSPCPRLVWETERLRA
jgi:hypothetical protein